eukprot:CAMPEP_0184726120 /NCGR_PEP_ID=MMETSP0314-20130426/32819_1 /TAXON_ID=38298 /ORGANISM="Rhodella maculata, Strain CCMP 736" /LENGTH=54 /DNA_ID=CAMNT_0027191481 /DNA_START=359 /DNA_END=522 /DNA_ORIENTATION=+
MRRQRGAPLVHLLAAQGGAVVRALAGVSEEVVGELRGGGGTAFCMSVGGSGGRL